MIILVKMKFNKSHTYFPGQAVNSFLKSIKERDKYIAANAIGSTDIATISRTLSYDSHPVNVSPFEKRSLYV